MKGRIMVHRILLVEDNPDGAQLVLRTLSAIAEVIWAKGFSEARDHLKMGHFDLILLDVVLPDGDGYRLCSLLQEDPLYKGVPIIFLTGKNTTEDAVLGFQLGADDYVAKPFDPRELKARVEAKLKKRDVMKEQSETIRLGSLIIYKDQQRVRISEESGQMMETELTPIEFRLLLFLAKEPGRVFSREEILEAVWGRGIHVYNRSVDTHISKLRKKLGGRSDCVESVHGSGYRFVVHRPVRESSMGRALYV